MKNILQNVKALLTLSNEVAKAQSLSLVVARLLLTLYQKSFCDLLENLMDNFFVRRLRHVLGLHEPFVSII